MIVRESVQYLTCKTVYKSREWKKRENLHSDCMISSQSSIVAKHLITLHKQPWCYTSLNNNHKQHEQENNVDVTNYSETIKSKNEINKQNIKCTTKKRHIPLLSQSSREHSVVSLLSASVLISMELLPMYALHATSYSTIKYTNATKIMKGSEPSLPQENRNYKN